MQLNQFDDFRKRTDQRHFNILLDTVDNYIP